ncbi:protein angel homolog 2 isoform X3 [Cyclopterus lumpus]|uniref:protein angel homolog 2 isoform X3 n=1 Tax=Cyclopterus lumpus TaxID=8103 RepID=UPI0014869EB2|nr:protein angel homolog 2 isoform X3 [Cyclopterus lumpus]
MFPNRNTNDVFPTAGDDCPMFLRQLSSVSSSFLLRGRPPLCRAGFRSSGASSSSHLLHPVPAPPPWWSMRGPPPRPPRLPPRHPAARWFPSGWTAPCPRSVDPGAFSGGRRSFSSTAGLAMERPRGEEAPPHKRRRSSDERDRGGRRAKDGGSETEQRRLKDGSRDREKSCDSRREDDRERTTNKSPNRGRGARPPGAASSKTQTTKTQTTKTQTTKTQTPKSRPERVDVPVHRPNAWFKEAEEQRGRDEGRTGGAEGQSRDRSHDGGQWAGLSHEPRRSHGSNPWQVAGAGGGTGGGTRRGGGGGGGGEGGTCPPVRQQEKSLQRHWEASPDRSSDTRPPGGGAAAFDFSVMTYNILSQELLQDNFYLYGHCHPGVLPWSHRLPNLLAEVRQHDADVSRRFSQNVEHSAGRVVKSVWTPKNTILCLQEVQEDHYENQIKPALQALGYQCEFKKRTGSKPDGCAVVFKTSRLSLHSSNPVEFFRPGDALLDRDNVALVLMLRLRSDPSAFICVANTHLLYNPRRGDIKLAQLAILLAEIGRLSRPPDGAPNPVVLCGDFNSTPRSPLYRFLTTGCLEYRGLQSSMVSGQEGSPRGQRVLTSPLWSPSLGINHRCQYETKEEPSCSSPTAVESSISNLTVEDLATKTATAVASVRARIEHSLKLRSSYQHRLKPDGRPEITTCHSRTAMTVDYILYTPEFTAPPSLPGGRGLQLLGRLSLVGQPELEEVDGLPNRHHSSDHLPLLARFRLRL